MWAGEPPKHKAVIDAAVAAGVAQLAYVGAFRSPERPEQLVLKSGLPYTFLRNN
jgi:NAD(P)H dehydrogenase (quinone)